jgi:hypothetical protein
VSSDPLYRGTYPLNNITPPSIERFESYYGTPNLDTTAEMYRYLLLAVDLDATGRYLDARTVLSTYPAFEKQLLNALLWSRFVPATVKGEPIASTLYLCVSFFGTIAYPTTDWPPAPGDSVNPLARLRIRTYADRVGLMSPPIPKHYPPELFALGPEHTLQRDTVYARLEIDTSGHAHFLGCDRTGPEVRAAVREAVHNSEFFPAVDFEGRRQKYRGSATFALTGTPNVRIRYLWLE